MASPIKAPDSLAARSGARLRHLAIPGLLLLAFVMFFYGLGSYPLFDLDEPRYAEAAREMLERGNWITPYFNYELRFDKPVFFYWLIALAYKLFGLSEFSARFFSAVTATLTVGMAYWFGRYTIGNRYGLFAGAILATSILFAAIARMSITDMTLACLMTATTLSLFMVAHRSVRWWLVAGLFAGLAVLTKGPVGLVVPGAIFSIYAFLIGDFKRCLLNRWLPLALLVCVLVALPWYVLAYLENGSKFTDALFLHNVTRFSDTVSGHRQPLYFYAIVLPVGFLPWSVYLPAAIRRFWQRAKTQHAALVQAQDFNYLVPLYAIVWAVFIFVFFTFSSTKLLTYILPMFPALALLTAEAWHALRPDSSEGLKYKRWFSVPAWGLVLAVLVAGGVFILDMEALLPREAKGIVAGQANVVAVVLMVVGSIVTALLLHRKNIVLALFGQAATMALVVIVALHGIVPNFSRAAQGAMLKYLAKTNGQPLMLYEIQRPSLTFYGQRRVPRYVEEDYVEIERELNRNPRTFVITKNHHLEPFCKLLPASLEVSVLEKDPVYSLLSVSKVSPSPTRNH